MHRRRPVRSVAYTHPYKTRGPVKQEHEDLLRRLALNDEGVLDELLRTTLAGGRPEELDAKSLALVRLAGLISVESAPASYQWGVAAALAAGASDGEIVGVLVALAPIVGTARVTSAAPDVAAAVGVDIDVGTSHDTR
jgi:4-carboxymuconolactone decarboxylase